MVVKKTVVARVIDPYVEISEEAAHRVSKRAKIGDVVSVPVETKQFGRIAAQAAKQVIIQGIREAERGMIYEEFNSKEHEILTGVVNKIDPRTGCAFLKISSNSDYTEAMLAPAECIRGEVLHEGDRIKVYVVEVRNSTRGPQVLISRTHRAWSSACSSSRCRRSSTARSNQVHRPRGRQPHEDGRLGGGSVIDPIGACVGPKGGRVASVVNELGGEKIDIVKYSGAGGIHRGRAGTVEVLEVTLLDEGRAAASSCRITSCRSPSARRGRMPAWPQSSPAIRSTSSPRARHKPKGGSHPCPSPYPSGSASAAV
ncbi:MAG: NusA N-terminal domain-containing protein [Oscillospiraceae bacterium]